MKNKKQRTIQKGNFRLTNPTGVVLMLSVIMAVFFIFSAPEAQSGLRETVEGGLSYGRLIGLGDRDLREIAFRIVNIFFSFLGVIAVLIIIYGGWVWMTSGGDPQKIQRAKDILRNAAIGLVLIFLSYSLAAFILRLLVGSVAPGGPRGPGVPPGACTNCSALGSGIIESVFPEPGAVNVPRNTVISVSFKVPMESSTLLDASGNLNTGNPPDYENVKIYYQSPAGGSEVVLQSHEVSVTNVGNKMFIFRPKAYLGDGVNHIVYHVRLGSAIQQQDTDGDGRPDPAFPPPNDYFEWSFTVGTQLDLDPPQVRSVFPAPDSDQDVYRETAPEQATGQIRVSDEPSTHISAEARITNETLSGDVSLVGTYSGTFSGEVVLDLSGTDEAECPPEGNPVRLQIINRAAGRFGDKNIYCVGKGSDVVLGDGLALSFSPRLSDRDARSQIRLAVTAFQAADTLQVSSVVYTFVKGVPSNDREIQVPDPFDLTQLGQNIIHAINNLQQSPDVEAEAIAGDETQIKITAKLAGSSGNSIPLIFSGDSAVISTREMSGGADGGFTQTVQDQQDQPRNAVIKIVFNESMLPQTITGRVETDNAIAPGVGALLNTDFNFLTVQADLDGSGDFDANEYVSGQFLVSNLFQTAEFQSQTLCGTCSDTGAACTSDSDCGGVRCLPQKNSCGDPVYCLPTRPADNNPGGATKYRVTVKAANLKICSDDDECVDPNFSVCGNFGGRKICQNAGRTQNYPEVEMPPDGTADMAKNSLDGDFDNNAEGPSTTGQGHNFGVDTKGENGDTFYWEFWVNNTVLLTPPVIENLNSVSPAKVGGSGVNLTDRPEAPFNRLLMESTLKSGSGYRDGLCSCTAATERSDCNTAAGEKCIDGVCVNPDPRKQQYCQNNSECNTAGGRECLNKRYVTLHDRGCVRVRDTGRKEIYLTGWWITSRGYEVGTPDGIFDKTSAVVNHTPFCEMTRYAVDVGSGIKDVYQNCYLPSASIGNPECPATLAQPYCCNRQPGGDLNCISL